MGLLINHRKLNAAAISMHQFTSAVRHIFPDGPAPEVLEASLLYLYIKLARDFFGSRFAARLERIMRDRCKSAHPEVVLARAERIARHAEYFEWTHGDRADPAAPDEFTSHVRGVIRSLLLESGHAFGDADVVREAFPRFDAAIKQLREHLLGIKNQHDFIIQ